MSLWRCPHCATPQAETARCWVCHKSSTTCSTCRHFRHSVAAQVGFCGLDTRRLPLAGTEHRGCWEVGNLPVSDVAEDTRPAPPRRRDRDNNRQFVPVELLADRPGADLPETVISASIGALVAAGTTSPTAAAATRVGAMGMQPSDLALPDRWQDRVTLFGDVDR